MLLCRHITSIEYLYNHINYGVRNRGRRPILGVPRCSVVCSILDNSLTIVSDFIVASNQYSPETLIIVTRLIHYPIIL